MKRKPSWKLIAGWRPSWTRLEGESEVMLVDDGSSDRSLEMMRDLHQRDPRVRYLSLARNFGHQIAVTAGLVLREATR